YGMKNYARVKETIKYGIGDSLIVTAVLTVLYQVLASPISRLFALTVEESSVVAKSDVIETCRIALHIATIGYVFMGYSVAVQGVLQGFNEVYSPLIISALRLIVFVLPTAYLFTLSPYASTVIWWTFPVAEVLTATVSYFLLKKSVKMHLPDTARDAAIDVKPAA
ncbi:MAG: MATE family efflux transporter, partial [Candidatus Neoclostridium sp.]